MTYQITADPTAEKIVISGGNLKVFKEVTDAVVTPENAELPFTKATADLLFKFLRGEDFEMPLQTKSYLKVLKDDAQTKNWQWSLNLHTLRDEVIDTKGKIKTKWDLIHYMPLRYIDKSSPQNVTDLELDNWAVVFGVITSIKFIARVGAVIITVKDSEGSELTSWFFQQQYLTRIHREGDTVVLSGKYISRPNKYTGVMEQSLANPTIDSVVKYESGHKIIPVYSEKAGKRKWVISKEIEKMLDSIGWIEDPVPDVILNKYNLMTRNDAYRKIHFPDTLQEAVEARRRLAFDDFVRLQVFLANKKADQQETRAGNIMPDSTWTEQFISSLPFTLTGAQQRVVKEIHDDMAGDRPMRRLLHGEVGSGKSEVALTAALQAAKSGKQVALMVPTGILAAQLHERFSRDIRQAGLEDQVSVGLLYQGLKVKERREMLASLAEGETQILIGTHSILSTEVVFKDLGLIVIDEQHKFGTKHRQALQDNFLLKSEVVPDLLMMSATPIPRTMSQTIYGDMDLSVIDELPATRKPVLTHWDEDEKPAWEEIEAQVQEGHQAYVIAALVDESESELMENVENATQTHALLSSSVFPNHQVGLVHGKMKQAEKNEVLDAFYRNEVQILVSTSVIEVGVNVPNATVITVLNANRFGIASLHQIRGRVGRGGDQAYCHLIGEATNPDAELRLNAMVASNDGFWLAEKDLEIRGEGSLTKESQSGANDMVVANLREHRQLVEIARRVAKSAAKSAGMQDEVKFFFGDGAISS